MTMQYSVAVRNARLDVFETTVGAVPILEIRTGPQPANCAAAASGTLLLQEALPSDWLLAAAAGVKSKNGTWAGLGIAAGAAGHFRIYEGGSPSACHQQGSCTATGGGGDMQLDNVNIAVGQAAVVTAYDLTAGNA